MELYNFLNSENGKIVDQAEGPLWNIIFDFYKEDAKEHDLQRFLVAGKDEQVSIVKGLLNDGCNPLFSDCKLTDAEFECLAFVLVDNIKWTVSNGDIKIKYFDIPERNLVAVICVQSDGIDFVDTVKEKVKANEAREVSFDEYYDLRSKYSCFLRSSV